MNRHLEPDFDQRLADWLEGDPNHAPREVLGTVLAAYPSIPQRRAWRTPWRLPIMFTNRLAAAGLALVLIVAGGGFALSRLAGPGQSGGGPTPAPVATATPTVVPTPSPVPTLPVIRASDAGRTLQAGTYTVRDFAFRFEVTLPAGWINQGYTPNSFGLRNGTSFLAMVVVKSVYADPCHTESAPKPVAPGIDPLLAAFSRMKGFTVTGIDDAVISGEPAKSFTLANSIDLQASRCTKSDVLWIGRDGDGNPVSETPSGADVLWIGDTSPTMSSGTTVLIGGPPEIVQTISWVGFPR